MSLTSAKRVLANNSGFTLVDVLIAFMVVSALSLVAIGYFNSQNKVISKMTAAAARDRIIEGVRSVAGNPAALRNSMRAMTGTGSINPSLLACAGGNPPNSCQGSTQFPLTLFSPVISMSPTGDVLGIQAVTAPPGSPNPARFDLKGMPCPILSTAQNCPFLVSTTFNAQCAPPALTPAGLNVGAVTVTQLQPQAVCTVADTVTVGYQIQLDAAAVPLYPELQSLSTPLTGSITTSVVSISGNLPQ